MAGRQKNLSASNLCQHNSDKFFSQSSELIARVLQGRAENNGSTKCNHIFNPVMLMMFLRKNGVQWGSIPRLSEALNI